MFRVFAVATTQIVTLTTIFAYSDVAAQEQIPGEQDVQKAQAFVAVYKSPFGGEAIVTRSGRRIAIYPGMLLFEGDVLEIVSGQPDVVIDLFQGNRRIVLTPDNYKFNVGRLSTTTTFAPPMWVRRLFASSALIHSSPTIARGDDESGAADAAATDCAGGRQSSVVQIVGRRRRPLTLVWGPLPIRRVDLLRADGSSIQAIPTTRSASQIELNLSDLPSLTTIVLEDRTGRRLREIAVHVATETAADSPELRLADAIASLGMECVGSSTRSLEAISRVAELRAVSPIAAVVYRAIVRGAIRW